MCEAIHEATAIVLLIVGLELFAYNIYIYIYTFGYQMLLACLKPNPHYMYVVFYIIFMLTEWALLLVQWDETGPLPGVSQHYWMEGSSHREGLQVHKKR